MNAHAMGRFAIRVNTGNPIGLAVALHERGLPGVIDVAPAENSVLLRFDRQVTRDDITTVSALQPRSITAVSASLVVIDVSYDGSDLPEFADSCAMSIDALIEVHQGTDYRVAFCGFAPGFAYLIGLDHRLHQPRRATPRTAVPAGSLAVAGHYTAVYPQSSPGGWHLLGSTQMPMFDPDTEPPSALTPGTRVRFRAVRAKVHTLTKPTSTPRVHAAPATDDPIEILSPGPLSLVQDLGRKHLAHYAVGASGAWDISAHTLAQRLVGNHESAAGYECVGSGLRLLMHRATTIAITGAPGDSWIESRTQRRAVDANSPHPVRAGEIVHLGPLRAGLRRWVAVRGGINAQPVLGSRSYDALSGLGPPPLTAGDRLAIGVAIAHNPTVEHAAVSFETPRNAAVLAGPDSVGIEKTLQQFLDASFTVSVDSNRVGVRLLGPRLFGSGSEGLANHAIGPSSGMVRGAIQIPPDGQPVVMGPDHPVTGGYPIIAVLDDPDSPAQWVPGGTICFRLSR